MSSWHARSQLIAFRDAEREFLLEGWEGGFLSGSVLEVYPVQDAYHIAHWEEGYWDRVHMLRAAPY